MKNVRARIVGGVALGWMLTSCGGGGDIPADTDKFSLSPAKVEIGCPPALVPTYVTIIGGQPPFRIVNTWPDVMVVDKTEATGKDPQFSVTATGAACADPGTITVLDYHSNSTTLEVSMKSE